MWHKNLGNGNFSNRIVIDSVKTNIFAEVDDFDLDGNIDIISISTQPSTINLYKSLGVDSFSNSIVIDNIPFSNITTKIELEDLDNDIIYANATDGRVSVYRNLTNHNYVLSGKTFYDNNQNGLFDSLESVLPSIPINISPNPIYNFTTNNGDFTFYVGIGEYGINYNLDSLWVLTSDSSSYTKNVSDSFPVYNNLNFGFYPDTILNNINAEIIGGFPRCNDTVNYWVNVQNTGTTLPSGKIHLQLNNNIDYVSSNLSPDSINGKDIYWHYDSLFYFSHDQITLQVLMPDFNSIGDSLTSYLNVSVIDSLGNQVFLASDTLNPILVCAYDPNDKIAAPVGIDSLGYISANTEYIEYTVRFQNTGNDTAITVNIVDQLDANLVWNTFTPLASSHPLEIDVDQNGEITFKFENILLPDSGADFLGSQGFLKYKINLETGLSPGTRILNTANIYFDQNLAVVTNTKINTIYDCTGLVQNTISNLSACENDSILGNALDDLSTTIFIWDIPNVYNSLGSNFNWLADTLGTFNLTISTSNSLCNKDTSIILTISPVFSSNQNNSICQGDSILLGGAFQTTNGIYVDSLQTINGCDSILSTTLTFNSIFTSNQNNAICQGDSLLIYGVFQNSNGVYYDSLQTVNGCDSVLSTTLTVNALPNVSLTAFNPDTLCDNGSTVTLPNGTPAGGNYTGTGVSGGNFDPVTAGLGTHDVIYTYTDGNSCINSDTTIVTVTLCVVGIDEVVNDFGIIIYPNPNSGLFMIEKPSDLNKEIQVKLLDATAKLIIEKILPAGKQRLEMDITKYSKGIYYLQLIVDDEVFVKQILKD